MQRNIIWKDVIIIIVIALAIFALYPPQKKIIRGLDLKGGMYLVMKVRTSDAIKAEVDLAMQRLEQQMKEAAISYSGMASEEYKTIRIEGIKPEQYEQINTLLRNQFSSWDTDNRGGGVWVLTLPAQAVNYIEDLATRQSLETIRNRVDQFGVTEPTIQREGMSGDRIIVQLPGIENPERVISLIQSQALLEWKAVSYPPGMTDFNPPDSEEILKQWFGGAIPDDTDLYTQEVITNEGKRMLLYWPLKKVSTIAGSDLRSARRGQNQWGDPVVDFLLTTDAGKRFERATREYLHKRMAILLDKKIISAPVIQSVIPAGQGYIEGQFTIQEAEDLALKLRSGALPAGMEILEKRTVGPSLGVDSIRQGITAGLFGLIFLMIFMIFYYHLSGINAIIALILNIIVLMGAMAYFKATLTLPGIAGVILTIGMAVDSNVLIFERIREELKVGKTVKSAIDAGFSRALITIIDTNLTTIIAALFLFQYGTGPVRGFAVTLSIGLLVSMFTAVFVSKVIFEHVLGTFQVKKLSI